MYVCVCGLRVYLSDVLSWMPVIQMTMTTTRTDEKLLHCESTVWAIRRLLRFLWGVKKPERCSGSQAMRRLMKKRRILLSHVRQLMMMSVCVNVWMNDGGGGRDGARGTGGVGR